MYKGTVTFCTRIQGNGLTFPLFEFYPHVPGVDKVEIEAVDGEVIRSTVHLTAVQSTEAGISLATKVNTTTLNRLAFCESIAIENARIEREDFSSLDDQPGAHVLVASGARYETTYGDVKFSVSRSPGQLKKGLEQPTALGERYYGLFRSARQSISPVEEFMHLYHILMMLFIDSQAAVDNFICREEPSVPLTPDPRPNQSRTETVYTRLRNELSHQRAGVDLDNTKAEMANRLGGLIALTKRAIELQQP
jgi:hypothetical protein